jgi:N-acetylglucosaminyl-diphospho-decaprenol L-rhamnosyltransferase
MATISAVIVNFNAGPHLLDCVRSLKGEGVDEIVVADNASTDGSTEAVMRAEPSVVVQRTGGNLGFGAGANRGAAHASGDVLLVMNPDTVVEPGMVKVLVEALDRDRGIGIIGPRVENPDNTLYPSARAFPALGDAIGHAFLGFVWPANRFSRRYKMLDWDHATGRDVDWVSGTAMMVRREAWDALGGFDEGYFMYVEDVDLCWRAWQAGWRVSYEPAARVVHAIGVSSDQTPYRMIAAHHRSLWRFSAKTARGARRAVLPLVAAGLAVRTVLAWVQRVSRGRPHAAP